MLKWERLQMPVLKIFSKLAITLCWNRIYMAVLHPEVYECTARIIDNTVCLEIGFEWNQLNFDRQTADNTWNACAYVPVQSCRPGCPAAMYRTSSMLFIASLRCHVRVPACAMRRLGRPGQQHRKEAKKPLRLVAILVLRSVTGQSCYRSYHYPYTLVLLKWSHRCLFCLSRAR